MSLLDITTKTIWAPPTYRCFIGPLKWRRLFEHPSNSMKNLFTLNYFNTTHLNATTPRLLHSLGPNKSHTQLTPLDSIRNIRSKIIYLVVVSQMPKEERDDGAPLHTERTATKPSLEQIQARSDRREKRNSTKNKF